MSTRNIVCVRSKDFLTVDYVNILFDAVKRNTTLDCRFICYTDDPSGLDDYIEVRPLEPTLTGWWHKLFMFAEPLEGQTFFFDLDTVIISNLDEYLSYIGKFAVLRDFVNPDTFGSALMSWHGDVSEIWDKYNYEGRPLLDNGDQQFIESCGIQADRIQDTTSGIYSYKVDRQDRWPHPDSKIICFHGKPRPHEVSGGWVPLIWRKGGAKEIIYNKDFANTCLAQLKSNMAENCKKDVPWFVPERKKNKSLVIVGGSPSLKNSIGKLRDKIQLGAHVMSVNGTLRYLQSMGIKPDYHCQFDARPENNEFLENAPTGVRYFIGSMSHPTAFDKLQGKDVVMWHGGFDMEAMQAILADYQHKPIVIVGGGSTVGLRALSIGQLLGYSKFIVFGMDSSFHEGKHHAYKQSLNDRDGYFDVWADGKKFECAGWMYRQAEDFKQLYIKMAVNEGCTINVIGDGLIPTICDYFNSQKLKNVV